MGSFANTLFSALLGWVQTAAAGVWQFFGAGGAEGLTGWLLDNWLGLTIVLCAAGLAMDLVVYIVRWQPYRVWRSRWKRDEADTHEGEHAREPMQWIYANGMVVTEDPAMTAQAEQPEMQLDAPIRPMQRVIPARRRRTSDSTEGYVLPSGESVQQAYHQPYYPPQWNTGEHQRTDGGTNQ